MPGARYVTRETTILLRTSHPIAVRGLSSSLISVEGSSSGRHEGRWLSSDDRFGLIFEPYAPFSPGETVRVTLGTGLTTDDLEPIQPCSYTFQVAARSAGPQDPQASIAGEMGLAPGQHPAGSAPAGRRTGRGTASANSLPPDFPNITTTTFRSIPQGSTLLSNIAFGAPTPNYLMILDSRSNPTFYRKMSANCYDFKLQPTGVYTYYDGTAQKFYAMDNTFAIVDSFQCGNGYTADLHDMLLLPNGHVLLMAYDPEFVDMSQIVPGGWNPALVTGLIIQELDSNKHVVFQWRSWDHYKITDAVSAIDLTKSLIDYVHGNALEVDADGNLLVSCRHMDEITKIDRTTGAIIWRWGGENNQFMFLNDSLGFTFQHAIRRISNGHYTLFDNGNLHPTTVSRALEYQLDQTAKTANLVWQYRNTPDTYGYAMGYVERLPSGNTLIGWGATNGPSVTEVTPDGTKLYEMSFDFTIYSYRAFRVESSTASAPPAGTGESGLAISSIFPNPAQDKAAFTLHFRHSSTATLAIYDASGREVLEAARRAGFLAGDQRVTVDCSSLKSGVYFCRLNADGEQRTRKLVVVH